MSKLVYTLPLLIVALLVLAGFVLSPIVSVAFYLWCGLLMALALLPECFAWRLIFTWLPAIYSEKVRDWSIGVSNE